MNTDIFPKGQQLPKEYFSGNAFLTPLVAKDKNNEFSAGSVSNALQRGQQKKKRKMTREKEAQLPTSGLNASRGELHRSNFCAIFEVWFSHQQ